MTSSFFFELPDHLKVIILDMWLAFPNTFTKPSYWMKGNLIGAVQNNHICRNDLTRLFTSHSCVFESHVNDKFDKRLNLIREQNIKIRSITVWSSHYEERDHRVKALQYLAPTLKRIEIDFWNMHDWKANYVPSDNGSNDGDQGSLVDPDDEEEANLVHQVAVAKRNLNQIQSNQFLVDVFSICFNLEHLVVSRKDHINRTNPSRLDESFCTLFTSCLNLQSLHLPLLHDISPVIVQAICAAPALRQIGIACDSTFADGALSLQQSLKNSRVTKVETSSVEFCALFSNLQNVCLTLVSSADLALLASKCVHITSATVVLSNELQAGDAETLCEHWRNLTHLTFSTQNVGRLSMTRRVPEEALLVLLQRCNSLVRLCAGTIGRLSPFSQPSPSFIYPESHKGSRLRELCIDGGTDRVLYTIVDSCAHLYSLHIVGMFTVKPSLHTVPVLHSLHLVNCTNVKYLRLSMCDSLLDDQIDVLRTVETLVLDDLQHNEVTAAGIVKMARLCTTLRALYLHDAPTSMIAVGLEVLPVCATLDTFACTIPVMHESGRVLLGMLQKLVKQLYPHVKTFSVQNRE